MVCKLTKKFCKRLAQTVHLPAREERVFGPAGQPNVSIGGGKEGALNGMLP
jgi:hypothetical protein